MKCVVFAYHNIGCAAINELLEAGYEISAVFTHQDSKNENIWFDSVAELAVSKGIPVYAPENVNHPVWVGRISAMQPDFIFSFYYRNILKQDILDIPAKGAVNLHGSLLPKYRGRVPINWAIINGETESGVTLHYMTSKPDAGDIIAQERFDICCCDTAKTVFGKAVDAAKKLLKTTLPKLADGTAERIPQNDADATTYGGRCAKDGEIDWNKSAEAVHNLIRAVTKPYPGAFSFLGDRKCFFWGSKIVENTTGAAAGTVISADPLVVACGDKAVEITSGEFENGICQS
ncbi:MAG: formyltransferase, partial [Lentisphaeria bacterium]|nr:formyltransferase [Lentisphaeria bacterium]